MQAGNRTLYSLDFFKFVACIGIILIHCKFPGYLGGVLRTCGKIGVPFFFMISGYFCLYKEDLVVDKVKILKKISHILKLSFGAIIFYSLFHIIFYCIIGGASIVEEYKSIVTGKKLLIFFVQNSPLVYSHLWFLFALIYCYVFTFFIGDYIKGKWKLLYIALGVLVFLFVSELLPMKGVEIKLFGLFLPKCLFLLRALPFFLLGIYLREEGSSIITNVSNMKLFIFAILGFFLAVIQRMFTMDSQFYIGTYVTVISIFLFCLKNPQSISHRIEWLGRNCSFHIYIIHVAVYFALNNFLQYGFIGVVYHTLCPLIVLGISLVLSLLWLGIKSQFNYENYK